jgi:pilus assembly protein Flp/PilA
MHALINNFLHDESGPTMVEYGLLVALIALVVGAAAQIVGTQLSTVFSKIGTYLSNTSVPASP